MVLPSAWSALARAASLSESNASLDRYFESRSRDIFKSSVARSMGVIVPPFFGGCLGFFLLVGTVDASHVEIVGC